jgi:hypothetical protein
LHQETQLRLSPGLRNNQNCADSLIPSITGTGR